MNNIKNMSPYGIYVSRDECVYWKGFDKDKHIKTYTAKGVKKDGTEYDYSFSKQLVFVPKFGSVWLDQKKIWHKDQPGCALMFSANTKYNFSVENYNPLTGEKNYVSKVLTGEELANQFEKLKRQGLVSNKTFVQTSKKKFVDVQTDEVLDNDEVLPKDEDISIEDISDLLDDAIATKQNYKVEGEIKKQEKTSNYQHQSSKQK